MTNHVLRQSGWMLVAILCALGLLALAWYKFRPPVDAHRGPTCGGAVCLALLDDTGR